MAQVTVLMAIPVQKIWKSYASGKKQLEGNGACVFVNNRKKSGHQDHLTIEV